MTAIADMSSLWLRDALDRTALAALDQVAERAGRPGGRIDYALADLPPPFAWLSA